MSPEEQLTLLALLELLMGPIRDGGAKRRNGSKPLHWTEEPDHRQRLQNHLDRHDAGILNDPDTGRSTMAYVAARALMLAWQEQYGQAPV